VHVDAGIVVPAELRRDDPEAHEHDLAVLELGERHAAAAPNNHLLAVAERHGVGASHGQGRVGAGQRFDHRHRLQIAVAIAGF